jgi:hypothetical protein
MSFLNFSYSPLPGFPDPGFHHNKDNKSRKKKNLRPCSTLKGFPCRKNSCYCAIILDSNTNADVGGSLKSLDLKIYTYLQISEIESTIRGQGTVTVNLGAKDLRGRKKKKQIMVM